MKKLCLFFVFASLGCAHTSFAQLLGQTAFLQGTWLQAAIAPNGSWGNSVNPPAGYLFRGSASANYVDPILGTSPTNGMDFSYDQGHDGFATGTPWPWYGSYYMPGTPYDGWQVQFGNNPTGVPGMVSANYTNSWMGGYDTATLGGHLGGVVSYKGPDCVNPKMAPQGIWDGYYGCRAGNLTNALHIIAVNEVDEFASWLNVTVKFYNTTDSVLKDVYYMASADPDNDVPIGGSFSTNNHIAYQGGPLDRHEVWARPNNGSSLVNQDCFTALITQDCRAKALIYQWWPPGVNATNTLEKVYAGTATGMGTCSYLLGTTTVAQDIAYGLVFNVGNIPPHDSAYITYAWAFSDTNAVDSIYQLKPQLSTEGKQYYSGQKDSVLACTMAGCQVYGDSMFEAHIINGENRDWALSTWTWTPSTGLSTTVGRDVLVDIRKLGGAITYTITGVPNPTRGSCLPTAPLQFTLYVQPCFNAWNTSPCYGDKLLFGMSGDSIGATYAWSGPKGWTATGHHPFKYPALYTDTGWYRVIKTIGTLHDTDSTHVVIHEKPVLVVTDNAPFCSNKASTLKLSATPLIPGETFAWTGPNGYTDVGQFPSVTPFLPVDTGWYTVIGTTPFGCKDTGEVRAWLVDPPPPPLISGTVEYCSGKGGTLMAVPMPAGSTDTIKWYPTISGGTPSPSPTVKTSVGVHVYYASQTNSFGCEGERDTFSVHIITKPPAPGFTGGTRDYCQFIGPFVPIVANPIHPDADIHWWTVPKGASPFATQPIVDLSVPGVTSYYVSQNDSTCESDSATISVTVHPKPTPPTIKSDSICQYFPAAPMSATASIPGDLIRWFIGSGDTIGTLTAPVPVTLVPGLQDFYVNELSPFGCLSDKAKGTMYVKPKPMEPVTRDTMWCQFTQVKPLTADSIFGGNLRWYINGITQPRAPVPHNTLPGDSTYYVANVVNGCVSDSVPLKVTVIYKPVFAIEAGSPFVCQFDSVKFAYKGPSIFDPKYSWSIPEGASYAVNGESGKSLATDSTIYVRFDSVTQNNYIHLHVTNNGGFCSNDTSVRIKIVPQPYGKAETKGDVCQGDTVILALGAKSPSAANFKWYIDNVLMESTNALSIVAHDNNSGGPFSISWNDSGRHVIQVRSTTIEGCTSLPTEDTIKVHTKPDAMFSYVAKSGLCLEDSVLFIARDNDYRNAYTWLPEHSFSNVNKREIYGRVEQTVSIITLQVTDPFGCTASTSQTLNPSTCCVVGFPSAFTPNGDGKNDVFRPVYNGYHRFHEFRIANRWGQTVFESTNSDMSWNGNFNGVPQDMGVYFYYIKYDCGGKSIEKTGDVTLIR